MCITCGKPRPRGRRNYCSDPCMHGRSTKPKESWSLRRERLERNAEIRICPCGQTFRFVLKLREKYCSGRCSADATVGHAVEWRCIVNVRLCSECHTAFTTRSSRETCSDECYKARGRRLYHEAFAGSHPSVARICVECGGTFITNKHVSRIKFCPGGRCTNRAYKRMRRHLLRSRPHEIVGLWEIGERDGWQCGLCPDAIDPHAGSHHPMGPTLDHITPVTRGGCHLRTNLQIAHRRCNSKKGAGSMAIKAAA